jgi:2-oxoglutarate ferredoxin oxidoreductase subunit alpha
MKNKKKAEEGKREIVIRIGGAAGQGIATAAEIVALFSVKCGLNVFSSKDYCSQIKGGHNFHDVRISDQEVKGDSGRVDILIAFDLLTVDKHKSFLEKNGIVIGGEELRANETLIKELNKIKFFSAKTKEIEKNLNQRNLSNAVLLGSLARVLGWKKELFLETIKDYFGPKVDLGKIFAKAAGASYDSTEQLSEYSKLFSEERTRKLIGTVNKELWSGNEAVVKAALKAGLKFHAQYPMTPVSAILHELAKEAVKNKSVVVMQPEDEIAGINMALGASYAGARAMTATSGGGFALMVEGLSLAGMAEIPLVIILGQRPGPATGLPTKTEQGDLDFAAYAGTGDFPRVVIAPGTIAEAYNETLRGFYLAEKYQVPVIILVDKHLAESIKTVELENLNKKESEGEKLAYELSRRINILSKINVSQLSPDGMFKRYNLGKLEDSLARAVPGTVNGEYTCAGDEHDETGEITEDYEIRKKMMERRMGKLKLIEKEFPSLKVKEIERAEILVIGWGSNKGVIEEAVERLNFGMKKKIGFLPVKYMIPFQEEMTKTINKAIRSGKKIIIVENNYSGQLEKLLKVQGIITESWKRIRRNDGKSYIVEEMEKELSKAVGKW